ncbi:hypothetical protein GLUCOINTEAF2_0203105 [Komagataeibacter intermedius AF2]|uniref:Uncharacterized protein n=1 Tax=Komagataeibacter intermedius AF2 TaxID=1458464 RepID=A0A0C1RXL5_9PROT|nr:hypothetical protein GLUCOINTEAF2_0203472 [Komagataeibacter intermedius AF2]KPH85934.1 hypothetical protein GLUCOINTEAF2_0203105 [Komagataeibacter intermedius AF2]
MTVRPSLQKVVDRHLPPVIAVAYQSPVFGFCRFYTICYAQVLAASKGDHTDIGGEHRLMAAGWGPNQE